MSLENTLAKILQDHSIGTIGESIFYGNFPPEPKNLITVFDRGEGAFLPTSNRIMTEVELFIRSDGPEYVQSMSKKLHKLFNTGNRFFRPGYSHEVFDIRITRRSAETDIDDDGNRISLIFIDVYAKEHGNA